MTRRESGAARWRRAAAGALPLLLLWLTAPPKTAAAQEVTGTVKTEANGIPVPGVWIWLMGENHMRADSTRTDAAGRFLLRASSAGRYVLYVQLPGYASVSTASFDLAAGQLLHRDVQYQLVSTSAMQIMGDAIDRDTMLQRHLPELCGEDPRPWETGLLVGVVRDRPTEEPIPGAVVMVQPPATPDSTPTPKTTVSNAHGTYVFCNVPPGDKVVLRVRAPGHRPETQTVWVRKGMIGWYDVYMARAPAPGPSAPRPLGPPARPSPGPTLRRGAWNVNRGAENGQRTAGSIRARGGINVSGPRDLPALPVSPSPCLLVSPSLSVAR